MVYPLLCLDVTFLKAAEVSQLCWLLFTSTPCWTGSSRVSSVCKFKVFPFQFRRLEAEELLLNSCFRHVKLLPLISKRHDASQGLALSLFSIWRLLSSEFFGSVVEFLSSEISDLSMPIS